MRITGKFLTTVAVTSLIAASPVVAADDGWMPADYGKTFYAGLFVGQQFFEARQSFISDGESWNTLDGDSTVFGGLVGWRHLLDRNGTFAALEADVAVGDPALPDSALTWTDFHGSARVRGLLGAPVHDRVTVFAGFGLAAAALEFDGGIQKTLLGVTAGVGVEVEVHDRFRLRIEGLHDSYGRTTIDDTYNGRWSDTTVRAAAIFDFN